MVDESTTPAATPASDSGSVEKRIERALFGTGEPAPVPPKTTPAASPEKDKGEESDDPKDEAKEGSEETPTGEETSEKNEESEKETGEDSEGDAQELTTEEVSKVLGVKEEHLQVDEKGTLLFRTKVGDDITHVSLDQLIKSYQTDKHVSQKAQKLYEDQQAFEGVKQQELQRLHTQVSEAVSLTQAMEQQLIGDFKALNMDVLRQTNPAEWAAKRQELADRAQMIQQVKGRLGLTMQEQQKKQQEAFEARRTEAAAKEAELILAKVPRWSDEAVASEEIPKMQRFLVENYGFDPKEVQTIPNHRFVLLALDAMKGREITSNTEVSKKIKTLPKLVKTGAVRTKDRLKTPDKSQEKLLRLKKSGSTADLASVLFDRLS